MKTKELKEMKFNIITSRFYCEQGFDLKESCSQCNSLCSFPEDKICNIIPSMSFTEMQIQNVVNTLGLSGVQKSDNLE
jgi:hypothetical protein